MLEELSTSEFSFLILLLEFDVVTIATPVFGLTILAPFLTDSVGVNSEFSLNRSLSPLTELSAISSSILVDSNIRLKEFTLTLII